MMPICSYNTLTRRIPRQRRRGSEGQWSSSNRCSVSLFDTFVVRQLVDAVIVHVGPTTGET